MFATKLKANGLLRLSCEVMRKLDFIPGDKVCLDLSDKGIEISKSFPYILTYDRIPVMPNGVLIGMDICRSKMLMEDEYAMIEIVDGIRKAFFEVEYYIEDKKIVIPLSDEQNDMDIKILRTVDEFGRISIPYYLRACYRISRKTGIEKQGRFIVVSNQIERKTNIDELGLMTIPQDILSDLNIRISTVLEIFACKNIIISQYY